MKTVLYWFHLLRCLATFQLSAALYSEWQMMKMKSCQVDSFLSVNCIVSCSVCVHLFLFSEVLLLNKQFCFENEPVFNKCTKGRQKWLFYQGYRQQKGVYNAASTTTLHGKTMRKDKNDLSLGFKKPIINCDEHPWCVMCKLFWLQRVWSLTN